MKNLSVSFLACLLILFSFSSCNFSDPSNLTPSIASEAKGPIIEYSSSSLIDNQYIVLLKDEVNLNPFLNQYPNDNPLTVRALDGFDESGKSVQEQLVKREDMMRDEITPLLNRNNLDQSTVKKVFAGRVKGAVLNISELQAESLKNDPAIELLEQDQIVALSISPFINSPFMPSQTDSSSQMLPYGIDRIGGTTNWSQDPKYMLRWAWILDTGVDMNHPDLNVNQYFTTNFTTDTNIDDQHGHGTHVAGIIAAKDNNEGVSGVAAGAVVVGIKVLKNDGTGSVSDIVAGLNFISIHAWPEDVINVSLGGPPTNAIDNAILSIANKGIKVVVAAGNSSQSVILTSPARISHPNVITVSAVDINDQRASFCNYGPGVEFAAPGVDILSTFKNGTYAYVSGTSMATPHVSGVMIVSPNNHFINGYASPDPNGYAVPIISY